MRRARRSGHQPRVDDLRSDFDRDDDEAVRDAFPTRSADEGVDRVGPVVPLREDEVVCRTCRLVVRRGDLGDAILLVCPDCYR